MRIPACIVGPAYLLLAITVQSTTSVNSRDFLDYIRVVLLILVLAGIAMNPRLFFLRRDNFFVLATAMFFIGYGFFLSTINSNPEFFEKVIFGIGVTVLGVVSYSNIEAFSTNKFIWSHLFFTWLIFFVCLSTQGFHFLPYPHFSFEYQTLERGLSYDVTYSQGITRTFGFGAISALFLTSREKRLPVRALLIFFFLTFISLSAIGGGRGDFIAVIGTVTLILFASLRRIHRVFLPFFVLGLAAMWILPQTVFFERLSTLSGAVDTRGAYLSMALDLFLDDIRVLIFGGGFGFFQSFFKFDWGVYPHNFFAEGFLVFGAPVMMLLSGLFLIGLCYLVRERNFLNNLAFQFFVFSFLIALKSGTLLESWIFFPLLLVVAGMGVHSLALRRRATVTRVHEGKDLRTHGLARRLGDKSVQ